MKTGTQSTFTDAELRALQRMTKLGFDMSSLNQLGKAPNVDALCASLARARCAPLLNALAVIEMLKWAVVRYSKVVETVEGLRHGN